MREQNQNFAGKEIRFQNQGFSLVEVIIAIAILAIISIPLLSYFTNSMKYNAKMRSKQQATMCAQEVVEELKVEKLRLIRPDGGGNYTVPCLERMGYTPETVDPSLAAGGTGSVTMKGTKNQFDIVAKITVSTADEDLGNPIVAGVNDATDVFAMENGQIDEAISFYLGKYNTAEADGAAAPAPVTEDDIRDALTQTYRIQVEQVSGKNKVTVTVTYDFHGDVYTSAPILTETIANVDKIYLLYNKIAKRTGEDLRDYVEFVPADVTTPAAKQPTLVFVCQDQYVESGVANPNVNAAYRLEVKGMISGQKLCTNISNTGAARTGEIVQTGFASAVEPLTENKIPARLVDIELAVYPKGDRTTPYTVVKTTKGE